MRLSSVFSILLPLLLLGPSPARASESPESMTLNLTGVQWSRVDRGEVLVNLKRIGKSSTGDLIIIGKIDRPISEVWRVMRDPDIVKTIYPRILKGELRARSGRTEDHYVLVDYPWPLEDRWTVNRARRHPDIFGYSWYRLDGNIKENTGHWRLFQRNNHTVLHYKVRFDPGLKVIPAWALRLGMKREAPGVVLHLRRYFQNETAARTPPLSSSR